MASPLGGLLRGFQAGQEGKRRNRALDIQQQGVNTQQFNADTNRFRSGTDRLRQQATDESAQRKDVLAKTQQEIEIFSNVNNPISLRKQNLSSLLGRHNIVIDPNQISDEMLRGPALQASKELNNLMLEAAKKNDTSKETGSRIDAKVDEVAGFLGESSPEVEALRQRSKDFSQGQVNKDTQVLAGLIAKGDKQSPDETAEMRRIIRRNGPEIIEGATTILQAGQGGGVKLTPTIRTRREAIRDPEGEIADALRAEEESKIRIAESLGAGREKGKLLVRTKNEVAQQLAGLDNIDKLFDKKFVGPIQGRLGRGKAATGIGLTKEEANFRSAVKKQTAELRRLYFGTAQTASELKNSLEAIPAINMPDVAFRAAMDQTRVNVNNTLAGLEDGSITLRDEAGSSSFSPEDAAELEELLK
ncbi:MAG: hypothetical protein V3T88_04700 [Nitrosomonadaceae bacterium]